MLLNMMAFKLFKNIFLKPAVFLTVTFLRFRGLIVSPPLPDYLSDPDSRNARGIQAVHVAVLLEGWGGNLLLGCVWLDEFYKQFGAKVRIDLYGPIKKLWPLVKNKRHICDIYDGSLFGFFSKYDLMIKILPHFVQVIHHNLAKLQYHAPKQADFVVKNSIHVDNYSNYLKAGRLMSGLWIQLALLMGWNCWDELGADQGVEFNRKTRGFLPVIEANHAKVLERLGLENEPYLTVHTHQRSSEESVPPRCWGVDHWNKLIDLLKEKCPGYKIVQIGDSNETNLKSVDLHVHRTLSLVETAAVLKRSSLHIDEDSSWVHMRHMLSGRSLVLYGPTSADHGGYASNVNLFLRHCGPCQWWFPRVDKGGCPDGRKKHQCMRGITPIQVLVETQRLLAARPADEYWLETLVAAAGDQTSEEALMEEIKSFDVKKIAGGLFCESEPHLYLESTALQLWPSLLDILLKCSGKTVADIKSGRQLLAWYLAKKDFKVTTYDDDFQKYNKLNWDMERKYFEFALAHNFRAELGSIWNLPADEDYFDFVLNLSIKKAATIEWRRLLNEMFRILKPGGRLILGITGFSGRELSDSLRSDKFLRFNDIAETQLLEATERGVGIWLLVLTKKVPNFAKGVEC
jgi:SAM-dependent methyltransferase